MARQKGLFTDSANYEPTIAAPYDARSLVEYRADLVLESTWAQKSGAKYIYSGMLVVVYKDTEENNGLYILTDKSIFDQESSWLKLADINHIESLEKKIEEIEITGGGSVDVELDTEAELPEVGDENATYYVKENNSIQRWDADTQDYVSYGGGTADLDINIINGGNSNG